MEKYEQWAEQKFEGLTREELRDAGKVFGCTFGPNTSEANMRIKLCEIAGQGVPAKEPEKPVVKVGSRPRVNRPKLNAGDVWEGRRHRVRVHRGIGADQHKSFVLHWDGVPRSFLYDEQVDMPEPYFEILKNAKSGVVRQRNVYDEGGAQTGVQNYDVISPRYSYDYFGVTPGTEHLPGSRLQYWQERAPKLGHFKDLVSKPGGRKALIQIRTDLYDQVDPEYYKDLTNEDILADILRFLGLEDVIYSDIDEALAE